MVEQRQLAVDEIERIVKSTGHAYISLGGVSPFFGFVGRKEWRQILGQFIVDQKGGLIQLWALVSKKDDDKQVSQNSGETIERPRLAKLRKKLGE